MMEGIKIPKALIGSWYSHVWDFFFQCDELTFLFNASGGEGGGVRSWEIKKIN